MRYAFTNGVMLDGTKQMEPRMHQVILTRDDKIEQIVSEDQIPRGYDVVDLQGQYIMPGLIDLEVTLGADGMNPARQRALGSLLSDTKIAKKKSMKGYERRAETLLKSGVTTAFTMGSADGFDSSLRDKIRTGEAMGPRLLTSGEVIVNDGGFLERAAMRKAVTIPECEGAVDLNHGQGADYITMALNASVRQGASCTSEAPYVRAVVDEAHQLGMKAALVCIDQAAIKTALKCGADFIVHGARPDVEIMDLFTASDTVLLTGLSSYIPYTLDAAEDLKLTPEDQGTGYRVLQGIVSCIKAALSEDLPVGLASGSGRRLTTHYDFWRELVYFTQCGASPEKALYSATLGNATLCGLGHITGSIQIGKSADMIVTKISPLEDLTTLRDVTMVVSRGRLVTDTAIRKNDRHDALLDTLIG